MHVRLHAYFYLSHFRQYNPKLGVKTWNKVERLSKGCVYQEVSQKLHDIPKYYITDYNKDLISLQEMETLISLIDEIVNSDSNLYGITQ